ncbi:Ca-activated chloride channel family protein [Tamaricihabitans halophyticus]|uniref:Ca-activated chloride channel family protein n=1 Tax=Tamaricihabitans halophyticus TaxID=1262583 RepID=A0A4R2QA21_9PSEU|nr:VWA domain-containing protein [Tamaricihabitans halophyticus]TCP45770.1 Ca-activated chloride channel family protein [Tamaricihabitans halophyticus]
MRSRRTNRRMLAGAGMLCAALAVGAAGPPAAAQQQEQQLAPVMVTLDASGSMADTLPSGGTKMDAAKSALTGLVDSVDETAELGLQVYGSQTGESPEEKAEGCTDVVTAQPVGPVEPDTIKQAVNDVEPSGYTPIGAALRAASDELPSEGPRAVVLISDGLDTCAPPDPCEVASELAEDGVDLSVHAVGFQVDAKAREQLSCIAESTGGSYTDASDEGQLEEELPEVVKQAQRTYEAQGTPITGTEDFPNAPSMTPGQHLDTIDAGQTKYYRLAVPENYTAHVSATSIIPNDENNMGVPRLYTRIFDEARKQCAENFDIQSMWQPHLTSTMSWNPQEDSGDCNPGDEVYFAVEREGPDDTKHWTYELELMVTLEPPVTGSAGPKANSTDVPFQQPSGTEKPVTGGGSFNDATELPGSGVYVDEMRLGEMATYKVKLDWGESVSAQTNVDGRGIDDVITVDTTLRTPQRSLTSESVTQHVYLNDNQDSAQPATMARVLYDNRAEGYPSLAGWHYITLQSSTGESDESMPVRLSVSKGGERVEAPAYANAEGMPAGPVTNTEDTRNDAQHDVTAQAQTEQVSGPPTWFWILISAIGGGALLTGGLLLGRQRKRNSRRANQPLNY